MNTRKDNVITFYYKFKRPKKLENDVIVIYSPFRFSIKPGETINVNMNLKIFLPKYVEARCMLLYSLSNQKLKLLNSNLITQKYNQNIEMKDVYIETDRLPAWNLNFELFNANYTDILTIKSRQELAYFSVVDGETGEITYRFKKIR